MTLSSLLILALIALMGWFLRSKHSLISKILYIISATGCILINLQQARVTLGSYGAVSYTHLTLPTNREV